MVLSACNHIGRDACRLEPRNSSFSKTQEIPISQLNLPISIVATLLSLAAFPVSPRSPVSVIAAHLVHKHSTSACSCSPLQLIRMPCHVQPATAIPATAHAAVTHARPRPLLQSHPAGHASINLDYGRTASYESCVLYLSSSSSCPSNGTVSLLFFLFLCSPIPQFLHLFVTFLALCRGESFAMISLSIDAVVRGIVNTGINKTHQNI